MSNIHFQSVIEIYNGNPYVLVTNDQAIKLATNWKKPLPVLVQINNLPKPPWKINMIPIGNGDFYLYLHGDVRGASKTKVGDKVLLMFHLTKNINLDQRIQFQLGLVEN